MFQHLIHYIVQSIQQQKTTKSIDPMDNVQIVKKRLKDLKQLSQNLKKTSQSKQLRQQNINIVKVIMNLTKDVHRNSQQNNKQDSMEKYKDKQVLYKYMTNKQNNKQLPLQYNTTGNNYTKQPTPKINIQQFAQYHNLVSQLKSQKQHRLHLQQTNTELTNRIAKLQQKIRQLQSKQFYQNNEKQRLSKNLQNLSLQQQIISNYEHISSFKIHDKIDIFLTKIQIKQNDYDKIQYQLVQMQLNLTTILLKYYNIYNQNQKQKGKQITKPNLFKSKKQYKKQMKIITIDLIDLINVKYLGSQVMILQFKQQSFNRYLFVKFRDYQHRRKWDLGIYVNFVTIKCLNKDKMFGGREFDDGFFNQQQDIMEMKQQQKGFGKDKQKLNDEDIQIQKHAQDKIRKILTKISLNQDQKQIMRSYYKEQQKIQRIQAKIQTLGLSKKLDFEIEGENNPTFSKLPKNYSTLGSSRQKHMQNLQQIKKQRESAELAKKKLQDAQKRRLQQQQLKKQRIAKKKQQLKKAKNTLKKGIYMTKYAQGALNPHDKRVFLSQDQTQLCWQDHGHKQKQYKSINVQDIVSITVGEIGLAIIKHVQKKDRLNEKCYLLIKLKDPKRKQLQFSMKGIDLMDEFGYNLNIFVRSLHEEIGNQ